MSSIPSFYDPESKPASFEIPTAAELIRRSKEASDARYASVELNADRFLETMFKQMTQNDWIARRMDCGVNVDGKGDTELNRRVVERVVEKLVEKKGITVELYDREDNERGNISFLCPALKISW